MSDDVVTVPPTARALRRDWVSLAGAETELERFDERSVRGMPEPARRWLTHAIAPGTSLWSSVILTMRGRIRLGTWRRFTAREVLSPPRGFIWSATARIVGLPVTGFDRHSSGAGEMRCGRDVGRPAAATGRAGMRGAVFRAWSPNGIASTTRSGTPSGRRWRMSPTAPPQSVAG